MIVAEDLCLELRLLIECLDAELRDAASGEQALETLVEWRLMMIADRASLRVRWCIRGYAWA